MEETSEMNRFQDFESYFKHLRLHGVKDGRTQMIDRGF